MDTLKKNARIAALLYLSLLGAPLRLVYIPKQLIVSGNAAATAANIAAHETLFRFGIVADLLTGTMSIFLTLALFRLFKDVDRDLSRLVVILGSLMVAPLYFMNTVNDFAALTLVRSPDFLSAFGKPQRDALAMLFLNLHHAGVVANEVFWGLWLFPFGLLVYRSRFMPRFLGVWLMVNCCAYVVIAVSAVLAPAWEQKLFSYLFPVMLGELAAMLWMLIVGAKERTPRAVTAPALPS